MTKIDELARAVLTAEELDNVLAQAIARKDGAAVHSKTSRLPNDDILSAFMMREAGGERFLGASGLYLAPGVIYSSADKSVISTQKMPTLNSTLREWAAKIVVTGLRIPETMITALPGRHVTTVIDLPCLRDPRFIIQGAWRNEMTMVKGRHMPTGMSMPSDLASFTITLPQMIKDKD